jgi:hypothetical protein
VEVSMDAPAWFGPVRGTPYVTTCFLPQLAEFRLG